MTNDKIEEEILKKSLEGIKINNFMIVKGHVQTAIYLTKTEYEKEINKNNGEWNKIVSEKQKEINDLKFKLQRTAKVWYDKGFNDNQIKTSKKVEELKKIIGKNALKRDWDYIKEIDEIFTLQNQTPQVKEKDRLRSSVEWPARDKPQRDKPQREEFSAVKKNGCSNNSSSPEEDLK